jgi:hypothetical protein
MNLYERKLQQMTYLELLKRKNPHWKHLDAEIDELRQEIKMEKELLENEK